MMETLQVILYVLGAIALTVLIILGIKLIVTVNKINEVVDDINRKIKTLDGFFALVDYTTEKIELVSDKVVGLASSIIKKISGNKKESEENIDE